MFMQTVRPPGPKPLGADRLASLNAVTLSSAEIATALQVAALLPQAAQREPISQAEALQTHVAEAGRGGAPAASAALHARLTALAKWTGTHDPGRQSDPEAVIAAAAQFPLSDLDTGVGFEPAGFQEMILFIEELPW
jgi:hypothetical protein